MRPHGAPIVALERKFLGKQDGAGWGHYEGLLAHLLLLCLCLANLHKAKQAREMAQVPMPAGRPEVRSPEHTTHTTHTLVCWWVPVTTFGDRHDWIPERTGQSA